MDYLTVILICLALAGLWWLSHRLNSSAAAKPEVPTGSPTEQNNVATIEDQKPLASRLQELASLVEPAANACAHPRELADHQQFLEAARLLQDEDVPLSTVRDYALGANWILSGVALAALAKRRDRAEALDMITSSFHSLTPYAMHFAFKYFLSVEPRPPIGAPLANARDWWRDNLLVPALFRDYFEERQKLGDTALLSSGTEHASPADHAVIKALLERISHPMAAALSLHLDGLQRTTLNRAFLGSVGRFWVNPRGFDALVEPESWREALSAAEAALHETPARSVMTSGESRVGKTSFLRLLAKRIERAGWTVFEAGGADLMADQQWLGQLEGRIQRTVEELAVSKKVIWYIPDLLQIAMSGTHPGQAASILDQVLPAITAGRLIIWTEASPASASRLLRLRPALRGALEVIRLEPFDPDETLALAHDLAYGLSQAVGVAIDPAFVEAALASARQYLSASSYPGCGFDLIRLTMARTAKDANARIEPRDAILTLSQQTGLPASILDNKERVDLAAVRAYFAARVMGQDEAVASVIDRLAMLKAGLNDIGKPIGVFLFAGPTGTGKTELAKTLAEFLFGSVERMIRLDMSEFQTAESTAKILASGEAAQNSADSLITLVRKQPFSVVLLDEFEKAHANIWDLFLQVFDDGRLADQLGQVADFRHCIIILTTNLGATSHHGSGLGFTPASETFSGNQVLRAVHQTFRPEFLNRLDKVIVFRPLTRDLMRNILKKELTRVLERRGLKDREWAVEWEVSALEFLLEKGFSPEMGARPLKRAIDQYLIAPLAATIVEKRFPEGEQFVFFRSDGRAIQAEFVDPDKDLPSSAPAATPSPGRAPALSAMILAPSGTEAELLALETEYAGAERSIASSDWEELKAGLTDRMLAADFWNRPDRYETLSRLALMDRVKAALGTAESLRTRLTKASERAGKSSRSLTARLALQLYLIKEGMTDVFEAAPIEIAVRVEPALEKQEDRPASETWCLQIMKMYRGWANKRHMQLAELSGQRADGLPTLLISGFGAHRLLEREAGLHVLELTGDDRGPSRLTARVRVGIVPLGDLAPDKLRSALNAAFKRLSSSTAVVRHYRGDPAPLVRDVRRGWRSGRLDDVLGGDFDLLAVVKASDCLQD